jgi:hypothetical protein
VDEVIVLGDIFDFLFGSLSGAFDAAGGLLGLLREKLQGKRLVCLGGNHDHHVVTTEGETRLELQLAGQSQPVGQRDVVELDPLYRLFEQDRGGGGSVRSSGDEPRLGGAHEHDRLRAHPSTTRRCPWPQRKVPLLEHRLVDLRTRPEFATRIHGLPPQRLARHGCPDRHR